MTSDICNINVSKQNNQICKEGDIQAIDYLCLVRPFFGLNIFYWSIQKDQAFLS